MAAPCNRRAEVSAAHHRYSSTPLLLKMRPHRQATHPVHYFNVHTCTTKLVCIRARHDKKTSTDHGASKWRMCAWFCDTASCTIASTWSLPKTTSHSGTQQCLHSGSFHIHPRLRKNALGAGIASSAPHHHQPVPHQQLRAICTSECLLPSPRCDLHAPKVCTRPLVQTMTRGKAVPGFILVNLTASLRNKYGTDASNPASCQTDCNYSSSSGALDPSPAMLLRYTLVASCAFGLARFLPLLLHVNLSS